MSKYVIYGIENIITGKWYIGITRDFEQRKTSHIQALLQDRHENSQLQQMYNQFGLDALQWHVIDTANTLQQAADMEVMYICDYDSLENGYNGKRAGIVSTVKPRPRKQRNFKLSDKVFSMLVDIAADDGTSYTETLEMLIIQEYTRRNEKTIAPQHGGKREKDT